MEAQIQEKKSPLLSKFSAIIEQQLESAVTVKASLNRAETGLSLSVLKTSKTCLGVSALSTLGSPGPERPVPCASAA